MVVEVGPRNRAGTVKESMAHVVEEQVQKIVVFSTEGGAKVDGGSLGAVGQLGFG